MARNKVNPKKGNQIRNWQSATHMRSATDMIRGLEQVAKHGNKKELSIREQSFKLRQNIDELTKEIAKLRARLRIPIELRSDDKWKHRSTEEITDAIYRKEKTRNLAITNLQRLARLEASNQIREQTRQKTLREMEKGTFPPDDAMFPHVIVKKIKKAGKAPQLETVHNKSIPLSMQKAYGKAVRKRFDAQPKDFVNPEGGRRKPETLDGEFHILGTNGEETKESYYEGSRARVTRKIEVLEQKGFTVTVKKYNEETNVFDQIYPKQ